MTTNVTSVDPNFRPIHKRFQEITVALNSLNCNLTKKLEELKTSKLPTQTTISININIAILIYVLLYLRQVLVTPGSKSSLFLKEVRSLEQQGLLDCCSSLLNDYPHLAVQFKAIRQPLTSDSVEERVARLSQIEALKNTLNYHDISDRNLPQNFAEALVRYLPTTENQTEVNTLESPTSEP